MHRAGHGIKDEQQEGDGNEKKAPASRCKAKLFRCLKRHKFWNKIPALLMTCLVKTC